LNIEQPFIEQLHMLMLEYLKKQRNALNTKSSAVSQLEKYHIDRVIQRFQNPDREVERVRENLQLLPFVTFGVRSARFHARSSRQSAYLLGMTKPIYVRYEILNQKHVLMTHLECLGKYIIAVPIHAILNSSLEGFHFIPVDNLHSPDRHYHHRAAIYPNAKNPLEHAAETCWGSVGALMLNALSLVDIPAIFESGCIFLERVNIEDILTRPQATRVSIQTYMQGKNLTHLQYLIEGSRDIDDIF
jgi:hypothetical protein